MKNIVKTFLYACPPLKRTCVKIKDSAERHVYDSHFGNQYEVIPNLVLFSSYAGRQFSCSPKQLYLAMLQDKAYAEFTFVWAFKEPKSYEYLLDDGRTTLVKYGSAEYKKYLACAKYWVSNTRISSGVSKKPEQIYVQTWHGTPLKKLGFDVEYYVKGADDKKSLRRSYLLDAKRFTYLLSPSPYYTEKMSSAFHLKEIGKEDVILELGYPRNDSLYQLDESYVNQVKEHLGIKEYQKVILYAPTWREENLNPAKGFSYSSGIGFQSAVDFPKLQENLGEDYVILLRTHYFVSKKLDFSSYGAAVIDVSRYEEINDLYMISDLLLTDYSSVFFDYAVLKKPMVFYMYDLENYKHVRDFYFSLEELPGKVIQEEEDLSETIIDSTENFVYDEKYRAFNKKFNPHEGPCSNKILKHIMEESSWQENH